MKALVTGGTGFLGKALSLRLQKNGFDVTVLGRNPEICRELEANNLHVIRADFKDKNTIWDACQNQDYVFHCGALSSPWGKYQHFYATNVIGTQHIIQGCLTYKVTRLIHVSTPSIYFDFRDKYNISENDPLPQKAVNFYAKTKLLAENEIDLAYQQGLGVITIRPRGIFGPGDTSIIPRLIKAHNTMPLPLFKAGKTLIDITYIDNVVEALIACVNAPDIALGKKFNITNDEPMYFIDLIEKLFSKIGVKLQTRSMNYNLAQAAVWGLEHFYKVFLTNKEPPLTGYTLGLLAYAQTLNISAAKNILGYKPKISIEEGLENYAASLGSVKQEPII